jgi:RNA polymerase sigma-70 factor (ECF subfamily)
MTTTLALDWRTILSENDRWLRTVVYSRLREPEAVEEVMQEIAVAAVRQAAPLMDASRVAPWLYRIAVRQVMLYRRKMGRRRKLLDRYVSRLPQVAGDGGVADPVDWLISRERRQLVRRALQQLPERDAEILLLKYTEDWSYDKIASHLGISHSAVEARLHRARKRMRDVLTASEMFEVNK